MIRRFSIVLLSLCLLLVVVSCSQNGGFSGNPAMIMVGLSMTAADEADGVGAAVQSTLEEAGHTVELAYAQNAEQQDEQIAALLKDGARVLVIDPVNALAVEEMLASGKTDVSGVTIIACGAPIVSEHVKAYVGSDYYDAARQQASRVVEVLGLAEEYSGKPCTLELVAGNGAQRSIEGAMEVLQPYVDAGTLLLPSGSNAAACYTEDPASRIRFLCKGTYAEHELDAVLCLGEGQAEQVVDALMDSYSGAAFPVVTGYGCNEKSVEYLAAHLLSMITYCETPQPAELTEKAMDLATAKEEVQDALTKCVPVTAENYKKLLVETGLYTAKKGGTFVKN